MKAIADDRNLSNRQKELLQEFADDVEGARPVSEALRQSRARMQKSPNVKEEQQKPASEPKKSTARPIWGGELGPNEKAASTTDSANNSDTKEKKSDESDGEKTGAS